MDKIFVDEAVSELHTIQDMAPITRGMKPYNWCCLPFTCRWISRKRCAMRG